VLAQEFQVTFLQFNTQLLLDFCSHSSCKTTIIINHSLRNLGKTSVTRRNSGLQSQKRPEIEVIVPEINFEHIELLNSTSSKKKLTRRESNFILDSFEVSVIIKKTFLFFISQLFLFRIIKSVFYLTMHKTRIWPKEIILEDIKALGKNLSPSKFEIFKVFIYPRKNVIKLLTVFDHVLLHVLILTSIRLVAFRFLGHLNIKTFNFFLLFNLLMLLVELFLLFGLIFLSQALLIFLFFLFVQSLL